MKEIEIKELPLKRFNALAGLSRSAAASYVSRELAWFSNEDETILGTLLIDTIDNDYVAILMARDEFGKYRCFDTECSIVRLEDAKNWLIRAMKWHTCQNMKICPQGGKATGVDLFTPVISTEKQHPYFTRLCSDSALLPARSIINEMMAHFIDIDGNFTEQFQSTGFDARVWELYLNNYFSEEELFIERENSSPDFIVKKYGKSIAVEAVIVGRKNDNPPKYFKTMSALMPPKDILEAHKDELPIKFGSPLFTKLNKEYWKLPHVEGNALVFAIADFHDDQSMIWSSTALITYLYGVQHEFYYDENNQLVIIPIEIETHKLGDKEIPSGYFFQPKSENVSAVLSSASGTISKFNRIGRQAGFFDPNVIMIRMGTFHDHDPNAVVPRLFRYKVDENSEETWAEGLSMYHNPNALYPIPRELFPSIAHHEFKDGQIVSQLPEFHPYSSVTFNMITKQDA